MSSNHNVSSSRHLTVAEKQLLEQLQAMTSLNTSTKPPSCEAAHESVVEARIEDHPDAVDGFRLPSIGSNKTPKPTRQICEKPSIITPDFDELDTTAERVYHGIENLRQDLDSLRKMQTDFTRSFKADAQKKLLEFRKKAAKVDHIVQDKLDVNNNDIFANGHPVREQRHRLTSDQIEYGEKMTFAEKELKELEVHMELIRINVIQMKRIEHPTQLEQFREELKKIVKGVTDVKNKYYAMEGILKRVLETELEVMQQEERFLKEEPLRIEDLIKRCKLLSSTLETLQKLAKMQNESKGGSPYTHRR